MQQYYKKQVQHEAHSLLPALGGVHVLCKKSSNGELLDCTRVKIVEQEDLTTNVCPVQEYVLQFLCQCIAMSFLIILQYLWQYPLAVSNVFVCYAVCQFLSVHSFQVKIFYLDYGYEEWVESEELYPLAVQFCHLAPQVGNAWI